MEYKWGTCFDYGFNHMYNDESFRWICSSKNQDSIFHSFESIKYDPDKTHCPQCSTKSFDLGIKATIPAIPKTTCANVLHINRRIFI